MFFHIILHTVGSSCFCTLLVGFTFNSITNAIQVVVLLKVINFLETLLVLLILKWIRAIRYGNTIFVLLLTVVLLPFVTLLRNEILLYSFPLALLFTYALRRIMTSVLVEDESEVHQFLLTCSALSVWTTLRYVYSYKYGVALHYFLWKLLSEYINLLMQGQGTMQRISVEMYKSFSFRRYKVAVRSL